MRAASFVEPARPDRESDALSDCTPRQSRVASAYAATASEKGVPGPEGSVTRLPPQEIASSVNAHNPRLASVARGLETRAYDINV
jgi:hypothetical protein